MGDQMLTPIVPFIFNSLWACIEPPVFIITTCFLNFGPLFRAENGPKVLWRSLRSHLLKVSKKLPSGTPAQEDHAMGLRKHEFEMIQEPKHDNNATARAQWELTDVSATAVSSKGNAAKMV